MSTNNNNSYLNISTTEEQSQADSHISSMERLTELATLTSKDENSEEKLIFSDPLQDIPLEKDIAITKEINTQSIIPNRQGNMFMFWYNKNDNPRICIGPHWPFTLCLCSFISIICFFYFYGLWSLLNVYVRNIGLLILFTQLGSYLITFLINPGLPPKEDRLENLPIDFNVTKDLTICKRCRIIRRKEDNTDHCEDCDVCVMEMDHHCPWTSKCIGKNNLYFFYVYVAFTFVLLFYLIFGLFSLAATLENQKKGAKKVI